MARIVDVNRFIPEAAPINEQSRLALDRVKSISITLRRERVKGDILDSFGTRCPHSMLLGEK